MVKSFFLYVINIYSKYISPLFPRTCRFYPTCSMYAKQAITEFGALKGGLLTIFRILRCNPFFKGGYDPVPKNDK